MEYPFRIFRETFIASLDTLVIPSVICKYVHTYERERVCVYVLERTASIVEKQVFFPFTELDKQQQRYLNGSSSQHPLLYIFLLLARRKINSTRDITVPPLFQPASPLCSLVQVVYSLFRVSSSNDRRLTNHVRAKNIPCFRSVRLIRSRNFQRVRKITDGGLIGDLRRSLCWLRHDR